MPDKDDSKVKPDGLTVQKKLSTELRSQQRYPCVGITLLYSPVQKSSIANLAEHLFKAAVHDMSLSGLAFEVDREMRDGGKLVVLMQRPECPTPARLMSEVRWCRKLSSGCYRIGIVIDGTEPIIPDAPGKHISDPIGRSIVPQAVSTLCPACGKSADFSYIGEQPVLAGFGVMPLYNCSECGTTRSLPGIVFGQVISSESD